MPLVTLYLVRIVVLITFAPVSGPNLGRTNHHDHRSPGNRYHRPPPTPGGLPGSLHFENSWAAAACHGAHRSWWGHSIPPVRCANRDLKISSCLIPMYTSGSSLIGEYISLRIGNNRILLNASSRNRSSWSKSLNLPTSFHCQESQHRDLQCWSGSHQSSQASCPNRRKNASSKRTCFDLPIFSMKRSYPPVLQSAPSPKYFLLRCHEHQLAGFVWCFKSSHDSAIYLLAFVMVSIIVFILYCQQNSVQLSVRIRKWL